MSINVENLAKIVKYFSPIAHTPGRLRVRLSSKIKELSGDLNLGSLDEIITKIDGIKNVKFNKLIGSVTIQYDPAIFAPDVWDDLLAGRNLAKISEKIDKIAQKVL